MFFISGTRSTRSSSLPPSMARYYLCHSHSHSYSCYLYSFLLTPGILRIPSYSPPPHALYITVTIIIYHHLLILTFCHPYPYHYRYPEDSLIFSTSNVVKNKLLRIENRKDYLDKKILAVPDVLQTLSAYQFCESPDRVSTGYEGVRVPLTYSDSTQIGLIKSAMLLVLSALPLGCIDESDERWADDFIVPWREGVLMAGDCHALMQCQIMLECGIKTGWCFPGGLKLMSSMPSRAHSLRFPSVGLVALRLWSLDQAIKYDKIVQPGEKASGSSVSRGRPKGVGNNPSGTRKKKKTF